MFFLIKPRYTAPLYGFPGKRDPIYRQNYYVSIADTLLGRGYRFCNYASVRRRDQCHFDLEYRKHNSLLLPRAIVEQCALGEEEG